MDRRTVLRQLGYGSAGILLWPGCRPNPASVVEYPRLQLTSDQQQWIEKYAQVLLPVKNLELGTAESAGALTLTMLNEIHAPEDIVKFKTGLLEIKQQTQAQYGEDFSNLSQEQQLKLIHYLDQREEVESPASFFHYTVKNYTLQHFTSSKYYLSGHLGYTMIPGKYQGCVPV